MKFDISVHFNFHLLFFFSLCFYISFYRIGTHAKSLCFNFFTFEAFLKSHFFLCSSLKFSFSLEHSLDGPIHTFFSLSFYQELGVLYFFFKKAHLSFHDFLLSSHYVNFVFNIIIFFSLQILISSAHIFFKQYYYTRSLANSHLKYNLFELFNALAAFEHDNV